MASGAMRCGVKGRDVVLVTGALGQVGRDFVPLLSKVFGKQNVVATDVRPEVDYTAESASASASSSLASRYIQLDVCDRSALRDVARSYGVTRFVHLATMLSAVGEKMPMKAHKVNVEGTLNLLEVAREINEDNSKEHGDNCEPISVFSPSTIAVFGPSTPRDMTPDDVVCAPTTMYGMSKVHMENLGNYYHRRYGIDFRSLRYPGVISCSEPGGGTTDYMIEMYQQATQTGKCSSFVSENNALPFMHVNDCLRSSIEFIQAKSECLSRRVYNVTAVSATPRQVFESIKKFIPECEMEYAPDFREDIALSWPNSLDDSFARRDWGWQHEYDLDGITKDLLENFQGLAKNSKGNSSTGQESTEEQGN